MSFSIFGLVILSLNIIRKIYEGCFFKFGVEVGAEESIVNEPLALKTLIFQVAD
jgi:hypothetical protein